MCIQLRREVSKFNSLFRTAYCEFTHSVERSEDFKSLQIYKFVFLKYAPVMVNVIEQGIVLMFNCYLWYYLNVYFPWSGNKTEILFSELLYELCEICLAEYM